jgi:uncharacterized protein YijF (DUF1287 family)
MTACSTNKPQKRVANTTQKPIVKSAHRRAVAIRKPQTTKKFRPVVYEKRSPRKRAVANNKRRSASRYRRPVTRITRSGRAPSPFLNKLNNAALGRLKSRVRYDGSYVKIGYPWGDVPANIGVCTDVVIRSYRKLGIDLQQQVHQDMSAAFYNYPNLSKWKLKAPDTNIDHRRVVNLRKFFARRGAALPITRNPYDYKPGDLVTWIVGPSFPHIGIVVNRPTRADPRRMMIVHNIAEGPKMEDILFRFPITGHYRYTPRNMGNIPRSTFTKRAPRRNLSRRNQMSYAQLLDASKRLGTNRPSTSRAVASKPQARLSTSSLKLANLSAEDARILLGK